MKKKFIIAGIIGVLAIGLCLGLSGCESCSRDVKTIQSDMSGGLDRTITVYDYNGNVIKEYKGKCDIQDNTYYGKVLFDMDGKRTVIYNAIVIAEEN